MCLSCEQIARQNCAMAPRWRFLAIFLRPVFPASRVQHISDLHLKFALSHTAMESVLRPEGSLWWERFAKKVGLEPGVKERGSYGW